DKEIGQKLTISPRTVNGHLSHIYAKLNVHSRTETMLLALEKGWVTLE
ncbi:MAG: response regulator transcription factor, partial [Anaerolineae bacterium]|nr:response regulator transcription factor [Anaerolineae bacterium]